MGRTVGQVDQVEPFGGRGVANPLQPDLRCFISVSPVRNKQSQSVSPCADARGCVPMKHDPLSDGDNALLGLIQRRELGFDSVVGESHRDESMEMSFDEK